MEGKSETLKKILVVEDDEAIRTGLCQSLSSDTLAIVGAGDLASARQRLKLDDYALILLDCNLPDGNGIDFCREITAVRSIPVLFLTVRDTELDEVAAFRAGCCDYVKKPFSLMVLRERITALLERSEQQKNLYIDRRYRFDFASLEFRVDDERVYLSSSEYKLLAVLVRNAGRLMTRSALAEALWQGGDDYVNENALSVTVSRLRSHLGEKSISTIYGLGYMWVGDPK